MLNSRQSQSSSQIIKLAQYLTSLTLQQDVWVEVGKVLKNFFAVDVCAFSVKNPDGKISLLHSIPELTMRDDEGRGIGSESVPVNGWPVAGKDGSSEAEILELAADTWESGFLNTRIYLRPEPLSILFLPIITENQTAAVMIVGHRQPEALPKDLLDVYLAVAGLVGTTITRLTSEKEMKENRERLSELVKKRTAELANANQFLKHEVHERKRTEAVLAARLRLMVFAQTHSLEELLRATLDEAEALTGSRIGFYHLLAPDQFALTQQIWSTRTVEAICTASEVQNHLPIERAGVWADCIREQRAIVHNDYAGLPDARRKGLPEGHADVRRELVVPVQRGKLIFAVLGVGNKLVDYVPEDIATISILADLAWDLVEAKRTEEALLAAHEELEERVRVRTSELRTSNQALEKALRAKDEFMATVSHEMRTPLTGVLGLSQVLQMPHYGSLSEKQHNAVVNIEKSGKRLLNLINNILDYSMLQSGSVRPQLVPCSLTSLCQNAQIAISNEATKKHQTCKLSIQPERVTLMTDELMLNQVLSNLLHNASKFTAIGGEFGIEATGDQVAGNIAISVWDNGIGIGENDLTRLFQPFVQLDSSLARHFEGTGLGLALVKLKVELLGGSVTITSQVGLGSRFSVILPWR